MLTGSEFALTVSKRALAKGKDVPKSHGSCAAGCIGKTEGAGTGRWCGDVGREMVRVEEAAAGSSSMVHLPNRYVCEVCRQSFIVGLSVSGRFDALLCTRYRAECRLRACNNSEKRKSSRRRPERVHNPLYKACSNEGIAKDSVAQCRTQARFGIIAISTPSTAMKCTMRWSCTTPQIHMRASTTLMISDLF